jgi:CCR4-NOT transcription complex subunit 6
MWQEQLRMHKESERAHAAMTDQQQPHYYARLKASENRGIGGPPPSSLRAQPDDENDGVDRRRPLPIEKETRRQDWHNMDMSGQGLRNLAPELFKYQFLNELFIASNKLKILPNAIGELRALRHLDASYNQIEEIPPEIGMCTYLKNLLLFNNNIRTLPNELGSLHLLEMLGIEGNPLDQEIKHEVMEKGTKSLISFLKENTPCTLTGYLYTVVICANNLHRPPSSLTPEIHCHSGGRIAQPGKDQSFFMEHSLRQVCDTPDLRIYTNKCSRLGIS